MSELTHDEIRAMLAALKGLPWKLTVNSEGRLLIVDDEGGVLAEVQRNDDNDEAHARFIAAAPVIVKDLLDECERLRIENFTLQGTAIRLEADKDAIKKSQAVLWDLVAKAERERDEARAELARAQETITMMGVQAK